jgi:hypothetical protein
VTTGRAASVHARLLARARERGEDFNLILTRYAIERFLYRLSVSSARDAAKLNQWRAFLGKNRLDAPTLEEVVAEVRDFLSQPLRLARERVGAL